MDRQLLLVVNRLSHPMLTYNNGSYSLSIVEICIVISAFAVFGLTFFCIRQLLPKLPLHRTDPKTITIMSTSKDMNTHCFKHINAQSRPGCICSKSVTHPKVTANTSRHQKREIAGTGKSPGSAIFFARNSRKLVWLCMANHVKTIPKR